MVKKIAIISIAIFWPLFLFSANTFPDFIRYIIPSLLIVISLFLYDKKFKYYFLPILVIPVVEPKLALLPAIYFLINLIVKKDKSFFKYLVISIIILGIFWKPFFGQTILKFDYEASQLAIQKSHLYNSIPLARTFQNKLRAPLDKLSNNFFSIIDPNNYFFGFAPRQINLDNQNLNKFPFIAIIFMIAGLINLETLKRKNLILPLFVASILNLSLLGIFDRQDFVLFIPIFLLIVHGVNITEKKNKKLSILILLMTIIFAIPEILKI